MLKHKVIFPYFQKPIYLPIYFCLYSFSSITPLLTIAHFHSYSLLHALPTRHTPHSLMHSFQSCHSSHHIPFHTLHSLSLVLTTLQIPKLPRDPPAPRVSRSAQRDLHDLFLCHLFSTVPQIQEG
jgi:hypothetical protein